MRRHTILFRLILAVVVLSAGSALPTSAGAQQGTISVAPDHACAVRTSGHVVCWGDNDQGELGDGTTVDRAEPVIVADVDRIVAVSVGVDQSCALRSDARVLCWGRFRPPADLGRGVGRAVTVDGLSDAAEIGTACAVRVTGSFWCWNDDLVASPIKTAPRDLAVADVSGGYACGVRRSGPYVCVGQYSGPTPYAWPAPVRRVGGGCIIDDARRVWCRGWFPGDGTEGPSDGRPVAAAGLTQVEQLSRNGAACAVRTDGSLWCWGPDERDQLGDGPAPGGVLPATMVVPTPAPVPGVTDAVEVSITERRGCVALRSGPVDCWGVDPLAPVGPLNRPSAPVTDLSDVRTIGVGDRAACAVQGSGAVACWGKRGVYYPGNDASPVREFIAGISDATRVAVGNYDGQNPRCAVRRTGAVACWGPVQPITRPRDVASGSLPGGESQFDRVADVPGVTDAVDVAVGGFQACALRSDRRIVCWGWNRDGQSDPASSGFWLAPRTVGGIDDAIALGTGDRFSCALRAGGQVWCWGLGTRGRTGGAGERAPHRVPGISDAVSMKVGAGGGCALLANGTVRCWGLGTGGQLGNGKLEDATSAVEVEGIGDAVAIGVGEQFGCAIHRGGKVSCWGKGWYGVLGDGHTTVDQPTPVDVLGLDDATAIDGGQNHVCATRRDRTVICWGVRTNGQLGDGPIGRVRVISNR